MSVNKISGGNFSSDKGRAQISARKNAEIVFSNRKCLKRRKDYEAAISFHKQTEPYTPGQMNYIDALYEKVFSAKGFDSAPTTHDPGKTRLRF